MNTMRAPTGFIEDADIIVVGGGIAGLFAAITAADDGKRVVLLTKSGSMESNTRYAQGGIAVALGTDDTPELHTADTVACGGDVNDIDAVRLLTEDASRCLDRLIDLGLSFDGDTHGIALTREAAHSVSRVVHAGGDATGLSVQTALVEALRTRNVPVVEDAFVTRILSSESRVVGIDMIVGGEGEVPIRASIFAPNVILATGGAGRLYSQTTNPSVATGDGLALAYRAGAELMDLEFVQFHPTALAIPGRPAFLISEAVRGEGGVLRDQTGYAFMRDYHPDRELAPRDIVSRSIWSEMERGNTGNVWIDMTHSPNRYIQHRFPTIYSTCASFGLDVSTQQIPVAPAAHYLMGGVRTDLNGATSLRGLYAVGEVACTGAHGANRLASNSLLDGLVFGRRAAMTIEPGLDSRREERIPFVLSIPYGSMELSTGQSIDRGELQRLNWKHLGIVRHRLGLDAALDRLTGCREDVSDANVDRASWEIANMLLVSRLMARAAWLRTESRGSHYRSDHPAADSRWKGRITLSPTGTFFMPIQTEVREPVSA